MCFHSVSQWSVKISSEAVKGFTLTVNVRRDVILSYLGFKLSFVVSIFSVLFDGAFF